MQYKNESEMYFAAREPKYLASVLLTRSQTFFNTIAANSYFVKIRDMWRAYHGMYGSFVSEDHQITFTGEQGELVSLPVNHFRNIADHIYTMITAVRPAMEPRAVNTDYKSQAQTYLARGILDYYLREKGLEECIKLAAKYAIVLGSGFIRLEWNATAGDDYEQDPETGEIVKEGEAEFSVLSPFDVVFDGTRETYNPDWLCVRTCKNRHDLIAKYPEHADKILALPSKDVINKFKLTFWSNDQTDDIPVYEFFHKRTESLPEGRYLLFLSSDVTLLDTPLPYRQIPIFRISPSNILGTPYGYTPMFDIFPLQEGINSLYSSIMTNQSAFMVQSVFVPRGADIEMAQIEGGMNFIEGNIKPEPLNLTQTPNEVFRFLDMLIQAQETLSGVNSVVRGNPEASLKSGNALALIQSNSLQFISGLQQSYIKLIEDVGTGLINILKDFAKAPKVAAIVGKNNKTLLKEFTGDDISEINRVIVDVGNPLAKTTAGRVQMAEQMMQMGLIKTPQEYFQVINTGNIDVMYDNDMQELLLIKDENEKMMEGEAVQALNVDQHLMHIREHKALLSNVELRRDPQLVSLVLQHIQQHIDLLRSTDPALLQMIGEQPLPPEPVPQSPQAPNVPNVGNSPNSSILQQETGLVQPGETITGPGIDNQRLPNPARPPAPFKNNPTNPQDLG